MEPRTAVKATMPDSGAVKESPQVADDGDVPGGDIPGHDPRPGDVVDGRADEERGEADAADEYPVSTQRPAIGLL